MLLAQFRRMFYVPLFMFNHREKRAGGGSNPAGCKH